MILIDVLSQINHLSHMLPSTGMFSFIVRRRSAFVFRFIIRWETFSRIDLLNLNELIDENIASSWQARGILTDGWVRRCCRGEQRMFTFTSERIGLTRTSSTFPTMRWRWKGMTGTMHRYRDWSPMMNASIGTQRNIEMNQKLIKRSKYQQAPCWADNFGQIRRDVFHRSSSLRVFPQRTRQKGLFVLTEISIRFTLETRFVRSNSVRFFRKVVQVDVEKMKKRQFDLHLSIHFKEFSNFLVVNQKNFKGLFRSIAPWRIDRSLMCDRTTSLTDPTADFVLSGFLTSPVRVETSDLFVLDLLTATEDLLDFSVNVLDTVRIQTHFNDRNRRVNVAAQLQEVADGSVDTPNRTCTVTTTLKYDLSLYVDRVLQACKRTKANLLLLRVARTRATNSTLLLVASTHVRVEQLNQKVQLLNRLVKENGGEFPTKKKKKKKEPSKTQLEEPVTVEVKDEATESKPEEPAPPPPPPEKKPTSTILSKEDLTDYVEIALSFRLVSFLFRSDKIDRRTCISSWSASIVNSFSMSGQRHDRVFRAMAKHLWSTPSFWFPSRPMRSTSWTIFSIGWCALLLLRKPNRTIFVKRQRLRRQPRAKNCIDREQRNSSRRKKGPWKKRIRWIRWLRPNVSDHRERWHHVNHRVDQISNEIICHYWNRTIVDRILEISRLCRCWAILIERTSPIRIPFSYQPIWSRIFLKIFSFNRKISLMNKNERANLSF